MLANGWPTIFTVVGFTKMIKVTAAHNSLLEVIASDTELTKVIQAAKLAYPNPKFVRQNKLLEPLDMHVYSNDLLVLTITEYHHVQIAQIQAA